MILLLLLFFIFFYGNNNKRNVLSIKVDLHAKSGADIMLQTLRTQSIHSFDPAKYPFKEALRAVFCSTLSMSDTELPALDTLHLHDQCGVWSVDGSQARLNLLQHRWNSQRAVQSMSGGAFDDFNTVYRTFINEVIGPILGGGRIVYQRAPGLRVSPPSTLQLGKLHNDRDYHHQPSELNFWLPLTDTYGNNTLWVESSPGASDFSPLTMQYGLVCKFYGNQCRHMTHPNNTNRTRVSIDFRAVSAASGGHDGSFRRGLRRGSKANFENAFDVGGFYDEVII